MQGNYFARMDRELINSYFEKIKENPELVREFAKDPRAALQRMGKNPSDNVEYVIHWADSMYEYFLIPELNNNEISPDDLNFVVAASTPKIFGSVSTVFTSSTGSCVLTCASTVSSFGTAGTISSDKFG